MTVTTSRALVEARESWHRLAEHVLAGGQFADSGTIRLRPFPGGFAAATGIEGRLVAVVADAVLVVEGGRFRSQQLTTLCSAADFAGWFALGDAAVRQFAELLGQPAEPVLWPEHFDLGIAVDAVNYGVSPGDGAMPEPYVYVGPHEGPTSGDAFWNAPFGATAGADRISTAHDAVAFCSEGRARVLTERSRT